jgi:hypothetical protein
LESAVLLPALFGATLEQTAAVLGVGRATMPRFQAALAQAAGVNALIWVILAAGSVRTVEDE